MKLFAVMEGVPLSGLRARAPSARAAVHVREGTRWCVRVPGPPSKTVQLSGEFSGSDGPTGISSSGESTTQH